MNRDTIRVKAVPCILCGHEAHEPVAAGKDYEYETSGQRFNFVRCRNCGHVYLNPRPIDRDIHKAYPAHYYTLEGRHTSGQSAIIARLKSFVIKRRLRYVRDCLKKNASVLEVGCGDGALLLDLKARYPHLRLVGMDFSVSRETRCQLAENNIELRVCRIEEAVLEPESFDLIIMNQLIEHVADPPAVIETLAGSLKPGGRLSIETPNLSGYDRRLFKRSFWGGYYFPRHLHLFDEAGMTRMLSRYGLGVERHVDLLAPIIWAFSVHGVLKDGRLGRFGDSVSAFFTDRNPLCLALFTMIDLGALVVRRPTSNQKFIVVKSYRETGTQTTL